MVVNQSGEKRVLTVLGPVPAENLGVVQTHEFLLHIMPGAEYAPEFNLDENEQFEVLKQALTEYRRLGGGAIVDRGGMFRGRNVLMYRTLSEETNVHIIGSTGLGPGHMVGSYFTTGQKNPPGPLPLEEFADLFAKEITDGIVVPRRERSGPAGIICSEANPNGITELEKHLYRAAARAALRTGTSVSIQAGKDPLEELDILEGEGLDASRVIVGGLDRLDADQREMAAAIAKRGAMVALDHVGYSPHEGYVNDELRAARIVELFDAGFGEQVLISSNASGFAIGHDERPKLGFTHILESFVPMLRKAGIQDEQIDQILKSNPQRVLTLKEAAANKQDVRETVKE